MKRFVLIAWILWIPFHTLISQSHESKDNFTGAWESPSSWSPAWSTPENIIQGFDITINGYITINSDLSFRVLPSKLIINDTLVVLGDLFLDVLSDLTVNSNGILIVRGNLTFDKNSNIIANNYLVVTGDIFKMGSTNEGSFISNNNPEKVFVGGTVLPTSVTKNNPNYPGLNCTSPATIRYPNSNCGYGNMTDFMNDPLFPFFNSTCATIPTPTITTSGPLVFCTGGSVTLTSSSGTGYIWSNGATTQNINVTTSGSYWVKITDTNGCESSQSEVVEVTVNALPVIPTITASGPTTFCSGGNVTLTSSTGTSYLWSNGATTPSIIVSNAGTYTVRITNASGCQSAESVGTIVTVNALPFTPNITASDPTTFCSGGSVTLTSTTGSTYLWSNGATTRSIVVTTAGNYSVRITNINGCQSAESEDTMVTVNALPETPTIIAGGPTTFCAGGSVILTSSSGSAYLWSNGATTQSINVSAAGNYSVSVTNANGCQSAASLATTITVNTLPVTPIISVDGPTTFCSGGSVTLTSSAGSTYLWSNGATTQSINVTTAGSYTVRITNASGCQSAESVATIVTVNALPATPTISANGPTSFCAGGSVKLTSSSGSSYIWSNGAITQSININATGSFTVKVTDNEGCQSAASTAIPVTANALPVVNAGTDVTIPNGTSTTLNSTVTGTGPFTYSWSPSAQLVNPLVEDPATKNLFATTTFSLTATSTSTSCSGTDAVTITTAGGTLTSIPTATPGVVCAGSNVQLNAVASGGSGTYTYTWSSTPAGFSSNSSNPVANPSVNTTYNVTVFDGFTTVNGQVTVIVNALPGIPTITADGPITFCSGGSVTLTSSTGTSYLWSNGETTQNISVTTSGNYTVQVTDANGCQSAASTPISITVNALPVTPTITAGGPVTFCEGGIVTLTSSAGTSYLWSDGKTTPAINVTSTGNYSVQVTNPSGCLSIASAPVSVTVNPLPLTPTITADGPTTFCAGGSVVITSSPGTSYLWSNGETTQSINALTDGNYAVQVTNASGCLSSASLATGVTVNPLPAIPTVTAGGPLTFCEGGSVTLMSSAGSSYLWSNGETTQTINVSNTGSYSVKVTNSNGCQSLSSVATDITVNSLPQTPTITANGPTTFCAGGSVNLTSSSGTSYLWSNGETLQSIKVIKAGNYSVQITNANGCQSGPSVGILVTVNALPAAKAGNNGPICSGSTLNLTEATPGMISYFWTGPGGFTSTLQNPSVSATATSSMAGTYTVTITDPYGCTDTDLTNVIVSPFPVVMITSSSSPMCTNELRNLTGSPAGGTFIITDGPGTVTGNVLLATGTGIINLVYEYKNVCRSISTQSITVNEKPVANAGPDQELNSVFESNMKAQLSSSQTGEWSLISGSGNIIDIDSPTTRVTGLSLGENVFLWTVRSSNCEAEDEISIVVNDIFTPTVITPNEDGLNDKLNFTGLESFPGSTLIIYNRWGGVVYKSTDYNNDWDGKDLKKRNLEQDTYYYILRISNGRILKGFIEIIR